MEEKIHEFFFAITEEEHVEVATEYKENVTFKL